MQHHQLSLPPSSPQPPTNPIPLLTGDQMLITQPLQAQLFAVEAAGKRERLPLKEHPL